MRKTKIVATIGPATRSPERLKALFDAGCNVARINMSHSSQADAAAIIADIRTITDSVGILIDTRGPEVRTTVVAEPVELQTGADVLVRPGDPEDDPSTADVVRVNFAGLTRALEPGGRLLLADGQIELEVNAAEGDTLFCHVVVGGTLKSKKGVNVPGVRLPIPFIGKQDASDLEFAVRQQADFVAASFVSEAEDVLAVREIIDGAGGKTQIISKIESRYAVKNLGEIIAASDGLMVARGDLGVEIPLEEVPVVQKQIIERCRNSGRTVIVATEMLESMIENPRPTRAEASDVANAIFEGTDAVMLSGETSVGEHPVAAVAMMARIARTNEAEVARRADRLPGGMRAADVTELVCKGAWLAAAQLQVRAILVPTSSGRTARRMARYRPCVPILATVPDRQVARSLALTYGVYARPAPHRGRMEAMVMRSVETMVEAGYLTRDCLVAVVAGVPVGRTGTTNLLTLQQVSALVRTSRTQS